jgi:hypothetical protein
MTLAELVILLVSLIIGGAIGIGIVILAVSQWEKRQ